MDSPAVANASYWLSILWWTKLFALGLVAIGVVMEFGGDWISRPFEKIIEDARKSEVAKLSADAESDRLARVKIEKAIIDELAQRDVKPEQREVIATIIKGHVGTIYLYTLADSETSRYAFAIAEALKAGGADVKLMLSGTKDAPTFPDKFNAAVSITGVTVFEANGGRQSVDLLVKAFTEAKVPVLGQWSEEKLAGVVDGKWVPDAGFQSPAIFVGLKPTPRAEQFFPPSLPKK